jgi:hypothetical protein
MGIQTWGRHAKVRPHLADGRILFCPLDKLLGDGRKFLEVSSAGILQLSRKAADRADATKGGGIKGQKQRLGYLGKLPIRHTDERLDMILRFCAFVPEMERHKHRCRIWTSRAEHKILPGHGIG